MERVRSERGPRRIEAAREELAERIARALPYDGTVEAPSGVHFRRHSTPPERVYGFYPAAFCVIAQGSKGILLGKDVFRYDPAHYLISTMQLPLAGKFRAAGLSDVRLQKRDLLLRWFPQTYRVTSPAGARRWS